MGDVQRNRRRVPRCMHMSAARLNVERLYSNLGHFSKTGKCAKHHA